MLSSNQVREAVASESIGLLVVGFSYTDPPSRNATAPADRAWTVLCCFGRYARASGKKQSMCSICERRDAYTEGTSSEAYLVRCLVRHTMVKQV